MNWLTEAILACFHVLLREIEALGLHLLLKLVGSLACWDVRTCAAFVGSATAGRNLIDGRNAAFGYVVDGFDVLEELNKDDTIISIDVLDGIENLKLHA